MSLRLTDEQQSVGRRCGASPAALGAAGAVADFDCGAAPVFLQ